MSSKRSQLEQVGRFYLLALALSWLAWSPLVLSRSGVGLLPFSVPMPWTVAGTLGPLIAALVMWQSEQGGAAGALRRLLRGSGRGVFGVIVGPLLVGATFVIGTALILTRNPAAGWQFGALTLYGFHWITTLFGGPIFEEWGWRGYAQPRLQARLGALPAALVVGLGWGLWHLPLFLVPAWSSASLPSYLVMVTCLSVLMAWGFNISGGWIVAAIAMHYTYNASSRVLGEFLGGAALRSWPDPVVAILLAFLIAAVLVALLTRGQLARSLL